MPGIARTRAWASTSMAAALAMVLVAASVRAQVPTPVTASRVLVMPFETATRDPRTFWLGEGSAVILTDSLLTLGIPAMPRNERLRSFELLGVPATAGLSRATFVRVGQVIGASQLIVGGVEVAGDTITVRAKPILLDAAQMGPEIVESGPLADIFDVYDRVAQRLVPGATVTAEELEASHPPIAAFEQFIKGLLAEAPVTKLAFLNESIRRAPTLHQARIAAWDVDNDLGDHTAALAAVRLVPAGHSLDRQARFLASISLLHLERYQEAFDALTRLVQEGRDAVLLNNLGVVQLRRPLGSPGGRAVTYFNEAAGLDAVDSHFNLGYAYWLDGDAAAAVLWLREAVRRNPADHAAHYVLGVALAATGSATEANRERELAKRLSSSYEKWEAKPAGQSVPPRLERLRVDLGLPAALRVENVIVAAGQRDQRQLATFHLDAGRRAYEAERDAEAIAELRRAVYLSPYNHEAHFLLGRAYLRSGRLADAVAALKISIWSTDTTVARVVLAETYASLGSVELARAELSTVLSHDPSHAEARRLLSRLDAR